MVDTDHGSKPIADWVYSAEQSENPYRRLTEAINRIIGPLLDSGISERDLREEIRRLEDFVKQREEEMASRPRVSLGSKHILVVDDDWVLRDTVRAFLEERGYKVSLASLGEEALSAFRKNRFDLVFLDVIIRGSEVYGDEVFKKIREIAPETKVVIMTGYSKHRETLAAVSQEPLRILEKPINISDIVEVLSAAGLE